MRQWLRAVLSQLMLAIAGLVLPTFAAVAQSATPPAPAGLFACGGAVIADATPSTSPRQVPATPAPADAPIVQPVADVLLPGGSSRFDYQSLDESSGRLFIAHMGADEVIVFDTHTQQVIGTVDELET